jgi:hypothetical protein
MTGFLQWWRQPLRGGYLANGVLPCWPILVLALWVGGVEAVVLGLLPALGFGWFNDHWRVGGSLPVVAALLLGGVWLDRCWPTPRRDENIGSSDCKPHE